MPNDRAVEFLSLDEAIAIHDRLIERFGGPGGIRDLGLLESALYRPRTGYYKDVVEMAAALFESVLTNHPFVDGNKRAALAAALAFLWMNDIEIDTNDDALTELVFGVAQGRISKAEIAVFFRRHARSLL